MGMYVGADTDVREMVQAMYAYVPSTTVWLHSALNCVSPAITAGQTQPQVDWGRLCASSAAKREC